ncbi:MAG: hypothetical protein AAGU04_03180 [Anaerolineaceae bacterium]
MIKIITDGTWVIPRELLVEQDIPVVPACVFWSNEQFLDRLHAKLSPVELFIQLACPVLGIKTASGAVALRGYAEA